MHVSKRRAFTLVELLVVLGIMIALVGLLFPMIGRAREGGKRVQCLSNLRQLTQAWLAYAGDNERHFCSSEPYSGDRPPGPPVGITPGFYWGWRNNFPTPLQLGRLWPYLNTDAPYRCPDDSKDPNTNPSSYAVNGLLAGPIGAPFTLLRLDDIAQPAKTFVFIEQSDPRFVITGCFTTPIYPAPVLSLGAWPGENHQGTKGYAEGTGISFADGHAIFWQYSDPRTGNLLSSTFGGINGDIIVDTSGKRTYPGAYEPNSPDVSQLEAWSGGPVPPGVAQ